MKKKSGWDYIDLFHRAAYNKLTQEDWEEIKKKMKKPDKKEIIHTFCSVIISAILLIGIASYFLFR
ncbi:MAG: hypothetical protein K5780_05855 [Alphaproteobacteria bacterium]|nr:hypothetical protein [Alphaproteobacteria bacterium]